MNDRLFKNLTLENWLEYDDTPRHIVRITGERIGPNDWVEAMLNPKLSQNVPMDVSNLFEVARGAMCYGNLFYPLFALGIEQVFRVMDSALMHRCTDWQVPPKAHSFNHRIQWMLDVGKWDEDLAGRWHGARSFRNSASHPKNQTLLGPDQALGAVVVAAELINDLYEL